MHPNFLKTISVSFVTVTMITIHMPASLQSVPDVQYQHCRALSQCGNIQGIGYPFWGLNRPDYCGYPEFHLDCSGESPLITILEVTYRVLEIENVSQVLKLVRKDYTGNICPRFLVNATLNTEVFTYTVDTQKITLYYGCSNISTPAGLSFQFNCSINGTDTVNYYLTSNLSLGSFIGSSTGCNNSVIVPVYQSAVQNLDDRPLQENLIAALDQGFGVQWTANDNLCYECKVSGGQCGYNKTTSTFTCYCQDRPHATICQMTGSSNNGWRNKTLKVISVSVYTTIALSIIVCWVRRATLSDGNTVTFWRKNANDESIETIIRNYQSIIPRRYSYSDIKKMTNSFDDKLGQGGFGGVYKGKLSDGRPVAVKVLNKSKADGEEFINEVVSISRTSHVNIVTLLGFCYERTNRALIYEYMPNGSLDKFIYGKDQQHTSCLLEQKVLYEAAIGIARGLEYLHRGCNTRIVHFDIKPHNILLDENFCPKISDFGLAKLCKREESKVSMTGARGTAGYIAPEVVYRNIGAVSYKSDVYSYGMMVLEMVGGRANIDAEVSKTSEIYFPDWIYARLEAGMMSKLNGVTADDDEETARKMALVGLWCIQTNPSDRPSMTKVVEMLEGSLETLQIPPKPFSSTPTTSPQENSVTKSSQSFLLSVREEEKALARDHKLIYEKDNVRN